MGQRSRLAFPRRGEVFLVNFDPAMGSEIRKTRPALILQNDVANRYSAVTIVAAISSKFDMPPYPTEVLVKAPEGGLVLDSVVVLNQVRTIDKRRLLKRLGSVKHDTMVKVNHAILFSFGVVSI